MSFEDYLLYMVMAAIATLVMWLGPIEQNFITQTHKSFIWNLIQFAQQILMNINF